MRGIINRNIKINIEREEIQMNKKKFLVCVLMSCFMLALGFGISSNSKTASAITQKQVKSKISALKKEVNSLEKQKKKALAIEEKQKKNTEYITGTVISFNPFIVESMWGGAYYWVTDKSNLTQIITNVWGYVKLTGKYREYNGYTCAVGKSVKVSDKSKTIQKKIDKKTKSLKQYQNSLKEAVVFDKKTTSVIVGKKTYLEFDWKYSGKFNKVKMKSSNTKIATVTSAGKVTAKKVGTVTISATCSLSKKTTKCRVIVKKDTLQKDDADDDYDNDDDNDDNDDDYNNNDDDNDDDYNNGDNDDDYDNDGDNNNQNTSYHAYLGFQTNNWDYRNDYETDADADDYDFFKQAIIDGYPTDTDTVGIDNASITGNGTYSVKIDGADFTNSTQFNSLYISTDIPVTLKNIEFSDITVIIDGREAAVLENGLVNAACLSGSKKYYMIMAVNLFGNPGIDYPENFDYQMPERSVELQFTVNGL